MAGGVVGWGECASPSDPYYCPGDDGDLLAHPEGFPGPGGPGPGLVDDRGAGRTVPAGEGEPVRQGGAGDGLLGRSWPARGDVPLHALTRRHAARDPLGGQPGDRERVEALFDQIDRYLEEGYRRIKLKIAPGWDVDVVRQVRERYPSIAAPGRRQLGLHARRSPHAPGAGRIRPAPDRAAAGPRRHHRPRHGSRPP